MVLIRNNVKKESTYGWYPPQVDIYQNPRAKHGYDKEMLFKHYKSKLHHTNPEGVSPLCTALGQKGKAFRAKSATPRSQRGSKIEIVRPQTAVQKTQRGNDNPLDKLKIEGNRAGINEFPPEPSPVHASYQSRPITRQHIPTPKVSRKYHGWQPQPTIIGVVDPDGPFINRTPEPEIEADGAWRPAAPEPECVEQALTPPTASVTAGPTIQEASRVTPAQRMSGSFRVQSASLHRPKLAAARTIKSASSRNNGKESSITLDSRTAKQIFDKEEKQKQLAATSYWNQLQHELETFEGLEAPVPSPRDDYEVEDIVVDPSNYDQMVDNYGWRMEAPGDPYRLKKAAMPQRLPYAVKCVEPQIAEDPYRVKVKVGDTFFYNTIPRKPATFTVHPEWQSEHFVTKRKELEKTGQKFHTRNYGFVY